MEKHRLNSLLRVMELERLAEIGRAVEAATLEGHPWVTNNGRGEYHYPSDEDIQDLISWHKGE